MIDRILRAIKLDKSLYLEVANNKNLLSESVIIVLVTALFAGVGSFINADKPVAAFLSQTVNSILFGWLLWSVIAFFIGKVFFDGRSSVEEMLRTLGYATAPRLLSLLSFVPCIGWLIALAGGILSLIAGIIAIRESMEFSTEKALVTAIIGFILYLMANAAVRALFIGISLPFQAFF